MQLESHWNCCFCVCLVACCLLVFDVVLKVHWKMPLEIHWKMPLKSVTAASNRNHTVGSNHNHINNN